MNKFNIILITIDSLRYDYFLRFMSTLKEFSAKSIFFTNAFSQGSATIPAIPRLLTASYNDFSIVKVDSAISIDINELPHVPFAGIFKSHGYKTAAFHSNALLSKKFGYSKGFNTFDENVVANSKIIKKVLPYIPSNFINKKAISWINKNKKQPFFLWIHYMDIHGPYFKNKYNLIDVYKQKKLWKKFCKHPNLITDEELLRIKNSYKTKILDLDKQLNYLLKYLKENTLLENSIVIITSDHGEEFLEHGNPTHGENVYDELIHVPMLISHPSHRKKVIDELVSHVDILPTILEMLNIGGYKFDGKSFLGLLHGDKNSKNNKRRKVFSEGGYLLEGLYCVRTSKWKYIIDNKRESKELFNLGKDPNERDNLVDERVDIKQKMEIELNKFIVNKKKYKTLKEEEDRDIITKLRDLGYV